MDARYFAFDQHKNRTATSSSSSSLFSSVRPHSSISSPLSLSSSTGHDHGRGNQDIDRNIPISSSLPSHSRISSWDSNEKLFAINKQHRMLLIQEQNNLGAPSMLNQLRIQQHIHEQNLLHMSLQNPQFQTDHQLQLYQHQRQHHHQQHPHQFQQHEQFLPKIKDKNKKEIRPHSVTSESRTILPSSQVSPSMNNNLSSSLSSSPSLTTNSSATSSAFGVSLTHPFSVISMSQNSKFSRENLINQHHDSSRNLDFALQISSSMLPAMTSTNPLNLTLPMSSQHRSSSASSNSQTIFDQIYSASSSSSSISSSCSSNTTASYTNRPTLLPNSISNDQHTKHAKDLSSIHHSQPRNIFSPKPPAPVSKYLLSVKQQHESNQFLENNRTKQHLFSDPQLPTNSSIASVLPLPYESHRSISDIADNLSILRSEHSNKANTPSHKRSNIKYRVESVDSANSQVPTDEAQEKYKGDIDGDDDSDNEDDEIAEAAGEEREDDNDDEHTNNSENTSWSGEFIVSSTTHKRARKGVNSGYKTSMSKLSKLAITASPGSDVASPMNSSLSDKSASSFASFGNQNAPPKFWTPEEDEVLISAVKRNGAKNWKIIASYVAGRNPTQCQQRWSKVLVPGLRKGPWSQGEDDTLFSMAMEQINSHQSATSKQMTMLMPLPYPNITGYRINWKAISDKIPGRTAKQCRARWINNLNPELKKDKWTDEEDNKIIALQESFGSRWSFIASQLPGRSENAVKIRFISLSRTRMNRSPIHVDDDDND